MTITLKTLPQATAQEVFDQVAGHLLRQMKQCINNDLSEPVCQYRYNGLMCAAGCLIAEDEYTPEMEGLEWVSLVGEEFVPGNHEALIMDLQKIHDQWMPDNWARRLEQLAKEEGLEWRF